MSSLDLLALVVIFFATSVISVVTGATSLITVPALLAFGVPPTVALGTNMLALTALSVGASVPFLGGDTLDRSRLPALIGLTLIGSIAGALLVFRVPPTILPLIIAVAMLVVAVVVLRSARRATPELPSPQHGPFVGYVLTLLLAVYGGFFSGGYVTLLTAAFVTAFQMPFLRAVATTKVVNVASSLVATVIFAWRGVIDWRLGAVLAVMMYVGATLGARWTLRLPEAVVRRVFVVTVVLLAIKTLALDVPWGQLEQLSP
ncbi:sulfite exporter TauE/SafE family protein [Deinococcus sp. KSM4-11]|uniref:sulfite exporter TauE/SafE family protein n=1 Tax=Deinococcus sp. KSM4-11 TaxID=2568654 RepID=UPI0010A4D409|nr:sulfite exporter TauE/SafE family protein [Deinococcus sp. KSM4-11]THF87838.1 sulfite exporter TauE/SafE family protein [Deinococcus sp. KSM4-11]